MTAHTLTPARATVATASNALPPVRAKAPAPTRPDTTPTARPSAQGTTSTPANGAVLPMVAPLGSNTTSGQPSTNEAPTPNWVASMADPMLALLADILDDLERTRIANENRLRQLTRDEEDSDGINRGFGLTLDQPQVASIAGVVSGLAAMEHQATLALQRALRKHPLGPWVKGTVGVGEKQGARLLAAIGDPYWNTLHDRPRTVSELWAFCGYHVLPVGQTGCGNHVTSADGDSTPGGGDTGHGPPDTQWRLAGVAPARARGQRTNWSATAKMRAYLVAEACMKQRQSPYRVVYDGTRLKYADATHAVECRRCGPKGKPAQLGSPLSEGHKHARALRAVAKDVLRDLWRESKRLHDEGTAS